MSALGSRNCSSPSLLSFLHPFMKFSSNYPNLSMLPVFYWDPEVGVWHRTAHVFEKRRQNLFTKRKWNTNGPRQMVTSVTRVVTSGGMGWSTGRTEVLGGQMAKVFNRYGDGNDCKNYLVSWLPLRALKGIQKKMRNWDLWIHSWEHTCISQKASKAAHLLQSQQPFIF